MRTNIVLDDELVEEFFRHAAVKTKRELVDLALPDDSLISQTMLLPQHSRRSRPTWSSPE